MPTGIRKIPIGFRLVKLCKEFRKIFVVQQFERNSAGSDQRFRFKRSSAQRTADDAFHEFSKAVSGPFCELCRCEVKPLLEKIVDLDSRARCFTWNASMRDIRV